MVANIPRSAYGSSETEQNRRDPQSGGDLGDQRHIAQRAHPALDGRDAARHRPMATPVAAKVPAVRGLRVPGWTATLSGSGQG
ncbi:MAG: hypothetical protein ACRDTH_28470 [Pseudonocardiaceae bacterium]